jgi:glycosyltransferase involved in cell wall biosynthesis
LKLMHKMDVKCPLPKDTDVVVLIPHYNNLEGLKRSLFAVSQSIIPVDVLVIDDGSSPPIEQEQLRQIHPSTTVLCSPTNEGIEHALNRGLTFICDHKPYKYVARLDADDICSPDRFAKQRKFLENNPDVFLVGSWALFVDRIGKPLWRFCPPAKHEYIQKRMFLNNMFCHPTVMCRLEVFKEVGFYSTEHPSAEDFALFFKVTRRFKVANIPEYLVRTFVTPGGISLGWRNQQLKSRLRIILDNFDFSFWAFYGLMRNLLLWLLPVSFVQNLKCWLFRP